MLPARPAYARTTAITSTTDSGGPVRSRVLGSALMISCTIGLSLTTIADYPFACGGVASCGVGGTYLLYPWPFALLLLGLATLPLATLFTPSEFVRLMGILGVASELCLVVAVGFVLGPWYENVIVGHPTYAFLALWSSIVVFIGFLIINFVGGLMALRGLGLRKPQHQL